MQQGLAGCLAGRGASQGMLGRQGRQSGHAWQAGLPTLQPGHAWQAGAPVQAWHARQSWQAGRVTYIPARAGLACKECMAGMAGMAGRATRQAGMAGMAGRAAMACMHRGGMQGCIVCVCVRVCTSVNHTQQVASGYDTVGVDLAVGGQHTVDQQTRHENFLKRKSEGSDSFRPKKRHRASVTKCMRILDNQVVVIIVVLCVWFVVCLCFAYMFVCLFGSMGLDHVGWLVWDLGLCVSKVAV